MRRTVAILVLLLTACGGESDPAASPTSTTTPDVPADSVVFSADLVGGCAMMGPNCSRYVVYGDGRIEGYRLDPAQPEPVGTTSVGRDAVVELAGLVAATDLESLRSRLPEGECRACVDGIDTVVTLFQNGAAITFGSATTELDPAEPLFAALLLILDAAVAGIEIPVQIR